MANVISYKGKKYVRVDSARKRAHRSDASPHVRQFEQGVEALESYSKNIPAAINNLNKVIKYLEFELKGLKIDYPYAKKLSADKSLLDKAFKSNDSGLLDIIAWGGDNSLERLVKQCLEIKSL